MNRMYSLFVCLLIASITFPAQLIAQDNAGNTSVKLEIDTDAQTLLEKYIEAQGGREAMHAIKDITMEAELVLEADGKPYYGNVLLVSAAPSKMYTLMSIEFEGQTLIQEGWCDGVSVIDSGAFRNRVLEGDELAAKLEDNEFNSLLHLNEQGAILTITDKRIENGRTLYFMEVKKKYKSSTWIIDAETLLRTGSVHLEESGNGMEETRIEYLEYETVEGMMVPSTWTISSSSTKTTISRASYSFNTNPPESTFTNIK
jgi:hypothetical protein